MNRLSKMSYGTTPDSFECAMKNALTEKRAIMPAKRMAFAVAMGILIIALACTALAMGLARSARYTANGVAQAALHEKYGITPETMGIFIQNVEKKSGEWIIRLEPAKYDPDAVGSYTVIVKADGSAEASWTNDGKPLEPDSGFEAEAWGQPQLEAALAVDSAHYKQTQAIDWENIDNANQG